MALFFRDRRPDRRHGQSSRFYDAVANDGSVRLSDFRLVLRNNIAPGNEGDPVSAGNLNFASGNAEFTLARGQNVNAGQMMSILGNGEVGILNMSPRPLTATSTQQYLWTALKLSNDKLLLVYRNMVTAANLGGSVVVADISWANRTIVFGAAHDIPNVTMLEVINSTTFCFVNFGMISDSANITPCFVSGRTVTIGTSLVITGGGALPNRAFGLATNPARMSNNSVCVVHETSGTDNYHADEFIISGNGFTRGRRLATLNKTRSLLELVSVNGGRGEFVLFTRSGDMPNRTVTAISLGFPAVHSLELGTRAYFTPQGYGDAAFGAAHRGPILLTHDNAALTMNAWVVNVDAAGAMMLGSPQAMNGMYSALASFVTVDTSGRYIFTGPMFLGGAVEVAFIEAVRSGLLLIQTPFYPFRVSQQSIGGMIGIPPRPMHHHFGLAIENANNPGEFLFLQHSNTTDALGGWSTVRFSFGYKTDSMFSNNIGGVALQNASGGNRLRVQVTSKLIPNLWMGLRPGVFYNAGNHGGLIPANQIALTQRVIGMAINARDFLFYGADRLM